LDSTNLDPTTGKEIGKIRPVLVISTKANNKVRGLAIIVPISTQIRGLPLEVKINNLDSPSVACPDLMQSVDWKARGAKFKVQAEDGNIFSYHHYQEYKD
jgi:mRNA interferase MazF